MMGSMDVHSVADCMWGALGIYWLWSARQRRKVQVSEAQSLTELKLQIEPRPDCTDANALAAVLEKSFQTQFSLRVPVTVMPPGSLPRFEMKAKRWVRI